MSLTRSELLAVIEACRFEPGDMVYIERRGDSYAWRLIGTAEDVTGPAATASLPDAWIFYAGAWPQAGAPGSEAFFTDLLNEMDGGAGGQDRGRWSADDPWPHMH